VVVVMKRGTILIGGSCFPQLVRVQVLNRGPKRSRVRFLSKAKLPACGWVNAGTRKYVPTDCIRFNGE
jgi:hypothetical protein